MNWIIPFSGSLEVTIVLIAGGASSVPQNLLKKKKSPKVNSTRHGEIKENVSFIWSCLGLAAFKMFQGIFFLFFPPPKLPSLFRDPYLSSCLFYSVTYCFVRDLLNVRTQRDNETCYWRQEATCTHLERLLLIYPARFVRKALTEGPPPSSLTPGGWGRGYPLGAPKLMSSGSQGKMHWNYSYYCGY